MENMSHSHKVSICGENFHIKSDVPSSVIAEIANYVDSKVKEIGNNSMNADKFKIAILAAMNIAGDYFDSKSKISEYEEHLLDVEAKSKGLSDSLDTATSTL